MQERKRARPDPPQGIIASICKVLPGGKKAFMELARFAPEIDPNCAVVIEEWNRRKGTKNSVSLDNICEALSFDSFHFLGVVAEASMKYGGNASIIIAALSMPKVIQRSIQTALTKEGFKDREALMKHAGFIPVPSGATFVNTFAAKVEGANREQVATPSLPSFESTVDVDSDA